MKIISLFICLLIIAPDLYASRTRKVPFERETGQKTSQSNVALSIPDLSYDLIKENNLLNVVWGSLEVDEEEYHIHWAVENRAALEKAFPPTQYYYEILHNHSSIIKNGTKFHTYEIMPASLTFAIDKEEVNPVVARIYTFYLFSANNCHMPHEE